MSYESEYAKLRKKRLEEEEAKKKASGGSSSKKTETALKTKAKTETKTKAETKAQKDRAYEEEYARLRQKRLASPATQQQKRWEGLSRQNSMKTGEMPIRTKVSAEEAEKAHRRYVESVRKDGESYEDADKRVKAELSHNWNASGGGATWFQKGSMSDGYQFGDFSKAITATLSDVNENITAAVFDATENLIDTTAYGVGFVGGLFDKGFKDDVGKFIARDFLAPQQSGEAVATYANPVGWANLLLNKGNTEENSVLGDKSDGLVQSGSHLVGSYALQLVGVPTWLTMGVNAFGSEIEEAFRNDATYGEAGFSGAVAAVSEVAFEKISSGIKFKGRALDEGLQHWLKTGIKNKLGRTITKVVTDAGMEATEEVLTECATAVGRKLSYLSEKEWSEILTKEQLFDAAIGGAVMGSIANAGRIVSSAKSGRDFTTGLTANEEAVANKLYQDQVAEMEKAKGKKLTGKEKMEIYDGIVRSMENGSIGTDTIESVLGGETYKDYQSMVEQEKALKSEIETLESIPDNSITVKQRERLAEARQQLKELDLKGAKSNLFSEVDKLTANDTMLRESYNEKTRKGQAFEADLSKYNAKQQETVKRAIDSGILNNTNRTHEFVDLIAKLSADKGLTFDFTNNQRLKESGFALDGVVVNGFVNENGVTININSAKALNSVVGHEITHVLEGTDLYDPMAEIITQHAKSKGEYDSRLEAITKLYEGRDANIEQELVADLVGDYLFSDPDFIRTLSTEHRNVFQKLYDEIKYLCKVATAGSKEARELEKVKKTFAEAYRAETALPDQVKYSITVGMSDAERYADLKGKNLAVITETATSEYSEDIASLEELKKEAKSKAEKIIYPLADKLGITKKQLSHEDIDVEFIFSKNKGLKESLSKQLRYGGNYADFAKALINLDRVLDSAILIEAHDDKYVGTSRADENLEAVYVLLGAFQDDTNIIPVQMEIKKSSDVGGRLYMTVALTKIEADVLGSTPEKVQTRSLLPASTYSLADIVQEINPEDAHFLKYLPDQMLSPEQVEAKKNALAEDAERIKGYYEEETGNKNSLSPDVPLAPVRGGIYGKDIAIAPVREDIAQAKSEPSLLEQGLTAIANEVKKASTEPKQATLLEQALASISDKDKQASSVQTPTATDRGGTADGQTDQDKMELLKKALRAISSARVNTAPDVILPKVQDTRKHAGNDRSKTGSEEESVSMGNKQRKWVGTSTESEAVDGMVLPEDLDQELIHYQPVSNKKTLGNANTKLDNMGYEGSVVYFKSQMANNRVSLDDIALGERLVQEAVKQGDTKTAGELIMDISILGTELGQKVQALSIIKRLTPEGQLKMLQKTIDRGKAKGDKAFEGVELTQDMVDKILDTYGKDGTYDQAELNRVVEDVKQQLADQMSSGVMDYVNEWRYLSMLGNPKTHIRNIVSNIAMLGTRKVKNAIARTIETIAPIKERSKTWKRASKEVKTFAKEATAEMFEGETGNKYSDGGSIKAKRKIFKTKAGNWLSNTNSGALSAEDAFFSKPAYRNSLSEYLTANGIKTQEDIKQNPEIVAKAKRYALEQSKEATFQQDSYIANKISEIERKSPLWNIAIGSVLPFKKTPINIAKTAAAYSPLGFARNVYDAVQVGKGNMEASKAIDHLAQTVTGTSLTLIGFALASMGVLNGAGDDDKDGTYDYQLGEQSYSLNINGSTISLSWLSPVAMPLFVGANAYEQLVKEKDWNADVVCETLAQTLDPLSEMSFLSSLDDVLSSYDSGVQKFMGIFESAGQSYITQFIPTLSSQIAATFDDTKRSTKAPADSGFKFGEETLNQIKYKIPGLRNTLEPTTDIWGNEVKQSNNFLTRAFESSIAPYASREDIATEIDEEIKDLYSQTGDATLIPSIPRNYVSYDGEKYEMSAAEYTDFKKTYGQTAYDLLERLFSTKTYKNADSETRADMVNRVYGYASDLARKEYFAKQGIEFTNATEDSKEVYKEDPIKGAIEADLTVDEYKFSKEYPEKYAVAKSVGGYEAYKAYSSGLNGIKADKDSNGKTISGSWKNKAFDYIQNLGVDYYTKIILWKSEYTSDDTYNYDIVEYLNSRDDISYDEMVMILRELGFTVDSDGSVTWD